MILLLFDPRPKETREDLFGRETELAALGDAVMRGIPLILLLGVRRAGKTSLLKVYLKESGLPYLYLDLRVIEEAGMPPSRMTLYRQLSEEVSIIMGRWERLKGFLKKVKGVHILETGVELNWGKEGPSLSSLMRTLDGWAGSEGKRVLVAFDEAQMLRYFTGGKGRIDFRGLLAYCYDNLHNLTFILSGSEVGILLDFLGIEEPQSQLYGRYHEDIKVARFTSEQSKGFLERGFKEAEVEIPSSFLDEAVKRLDGIVGWLTFYGYKAVREGAPTYATVEEVVEEASKMSEVEVWRLVARSSGYLLILRAINEGRSTWAEIKRASELWAGRPISNTQITRLITRLSKMSIVEKINDSYFIVDPITREAVKRVVSDRPSRLYAGT